MADAPDIGIVGLRQFIKHLEALGTDVQDLKDAWTRIGNIVAQEARSLAPVQSGRLASTIRPSKQKGGVTIRAGGTSAVPYGAVIHFGWPARHIHKNPFLYKASDNKRAEVVEAVTQELNKLIEQLGL